MAVNKEWVLDKAIEIAKASVSSDAAKVTNQDTGIDLGEYIEEIYKKLCEIANQAIE